MSTSTTPEPKPFKFGKTHEGPHKRLLEILSLRGQSWAVDKFLSPEDRKKVPPPPYTASELESVLADIPLSDQGEALAQAVFYGDLQIAKRLVELHGPIATLIEKNATQTFLNDEVLYTHHVKHFFRNAASAGEIAELMEWLPSAGLGWMAGIESEHCELMCYGSLEKVSQFVRSTWFEGELPTFANGAITNPDLLLALHEKKDRSAYPALYDKILCWVPEHTVAKFPHDLVPYESRHQVLVESLSHRRPDQTRWIPLSACDTDLFNSLENEWAAKNDPDRKYKALSFRDLELKTASTTNSGDDPEANMLLGHMVDESVRHGFWERPGMVLCQSTVGFLSQFEMGACQPGNQHLTQAFINSYAPVDLFALSNADADKLNWMLFRVSVGFKRGTESDQYAVNDLLTRLEAAQPLRSQIKGAISKELVTFLSEYLGDGKLNARSLGTLYREFGIDNSGMSLRLYPEDIETLHRAGYRFSAETKVSTTVAIDTDKQPGKAQVVLSFVGAFSWDQERYEGMFEKAISMGIWPTDETPQPETVSAALVSLAKRRPPAKWVQNQALASLRGYLRNAGPEECALAAKSDKQWQVLGEVFGTDVLLPWMPAASLKAIGGLFMKDLGL
jgi:hypothetical protein